MILLAELLSSIVAAVLLCLAVVLAVQCVLGSRPWRDRPAPALPPRTRFAVLVPAHDEALGIGATVRGLVPQLGEHGRLVVVADNCTDDTAAQALAAAREAGLAGLVTVLERRDPSRRGKGHALAFGLEWLAKDPPDAVVFVDADCRVTAGSVAELAAWAIASARPVQADYVMDAPAAASPLAAIGALAFLVRNRVRPQGMARMSMPCQLTGSGMALPWSSTAHARHLEGNIVEDMVLGLRLAADGRPPLLCPEVRVTSELPVADRDASRQRRRWEHGHLATLFAEGPRLFWRGLAGRRVDVLALALDLAVPPLALFTLAVGATFAAALVLALLAGPGPSLWMSGAALLLLVAAVLLAWTRRARDVVPLKHLLTIPFYVLWKIPIYLGLLVRRERGWRRTRRAGEGAS